jgi:hypothetical protein
MPYLILKLNMLDFRNPTHIRKFNELCVHVKLVNVLLQHHMTHADFEHAKDLVKVHLRNKAANGGCLLNNHFHLHWEHYIPMVSIPVEVWG